MVPVFAQSGLVIDHLRSLVTTGPWPVEMMSWKAAARQKGRAGLALPFCFGRPRFTIVVILAPFCYDNQKEGGYPMALTKTEARIPARMPHEVYERIAAASQAVGATLNQFLVQSALDRANDVLERERMIALSVEAAGVFLKATARQHDDKGISRTFVLYEPGKPAAILGYFTLTLCEVRTEHLPEKYAKKYPAHGLPAVRLARLAVARKFQGKGPRHLFEQTDLSF